MTLRDLEPGSGTDLTDCLTWAGYLRLGPDVVTTDEELARAATILAEVRTR